MDTKTIELIVELAKVIAVVMIATSFFSAVGGVVKVAIVYKSKMYWEFLMKVYEMFWKFVEKF